jgi:hypothetical protein
LAIHFEVSVSIFLRKYCSETWLCWSPLLAIITAKIVEVAKSQGMIQNKFCSYHRSYLHICINCMKRHKRYVRHAAQWDCVIVSSQTPNVIHLMKNVDWFSVALLTLKFILLWTAVHYRSSWSPCIDNYDS